MVGMDRYQGALQLQEQAQHLGVMRSGNALAAAYLAGDKDALARQTAAIRNLSAGAPVQEPLGQLAVYGLYLDNDGRLTSGAAFWRIAATNAPGSTALQSGLAAAQPYLLAQAA